MILQMETKRLTQRSSDQPNAVGRVGGSLRWQGYDWLWLAKVHSSSAAPLLPLPLGSDELPAAPMRMMPQ